MATATVQRIADLSPLWEMLYSLSWLQIPSDLTEIDAHWCYCRLAASEDGRITGLLPAADWEAMNGFAQSLRAIWGRAREAGDESGMDLRDW